jgi:hypothetical protein
MLRYSRPFTLVSRSRLHIPSCHVLGKALVKSTKHIKVACLCSVRETTASLNMQACSRVHLCCQKPACSSGRIPSFSNASLSLFKITLSYTSEMHDVSEIGRYEAASCGSRPPSLKIKWIMALCQIVGLTPVFRIKLNKKCKDSKRESPPCLRASF